MNMYRWMFIALYFDQPIGCTVNFAHVFIIENLFPYSRSHFIIVAVNKLSALPIRRNQLLDLGRGKVHRFAQSQGSGADIRF